MISSNVKDVRSRIRTALSASPLFPLRQLQVEYLDDRIVLAGRVDNFYQKQLAQEVARSISADIELLNTVEVGRG
ncbi:BON domain-containing protein [Blastopirellula retiformator]|uniref:BON domain protein n=1 Tax=Blastopirellula retiformator TaxID=2527970 RepID=A0A5C5VMU4_9BACT|nr:BON domain-containing protein [Blastopirellula retiformator]TWT39377.1 BON domain protein [Blastopirellula retiformator]